MGGKPHLHTALDSIFHTEAQTCDMKKVSGDPEYIIFKVRGSWLHIAVT